MLPSVSNLSTGQHRSNRQPFFQLETMHQATILKTSNHPSISQPYKQQATILPTGNHIASANHPANSQPFSNMQ
jgi:hypothetical protein